MLKKLTTEEVSEVRGGLEDADNACIDTCKGQCQDAADAANGDESKSEAWERHYL